MSGDLHAIAIGRMLHTGTFDLSSNPVVAVLTGPVGTRPTGWPSGIRKDRRTTLAASADG